MSSVSIKYVDRDTVTQAVKNYVTELRATRDEVKRIIWFGSRVNGLPSPGGDVDICLVLTHSKEKSIRERVPDYLPVGFPVGMDLFPYTEDEFEKLKAGSPGWYACIVSGREM